ncbi:nucleoside diphosphate kinase 6-like [Amphiura filiformis]|uniref:nucleoside diphosphate kinase 6-like n=1 Tax=Amphiura filiformis TaxID=82378 RepID=UPI003B2235E5
MRALFRKLITSTLTPGGAPWRPMMTSNGDGRLQLTLAIIKPDVVAHPHRLEEVKEEIVENEFYFIQSKIVKWSKSDAEKFYGEHKGRFFYNRLVGFMSMGPMSVHVLARQNAIKHWRNLMGPTKTFRAKHEAPGSLRARYGLTDTRNATHGSDSDENAKKEIGLFFPDFDVGSWYASEEELFRTGKVTFCSQSGVHVIDTSDR